jgi:hypothetical protein
MGKKDYIAGLKYFLSENLRDFNQRHPRGQKNFSQSYADYFVEPAEEVPFNLNQHKQKLRC